jgi:hypothetical protein
MVALILRCASSGDRVAAFGNSRSLLRWAKLQRGFDHADCIVHDADQVVLKEVRLEAIERLLKIRGKHAQRIHTLRAFGCLCGLESPTMQPSNLAQDQLRVLPSYFSRIVERNTEFVAARDGRIDFLLEQICDLFIKHFRRSRSLISREKKDKHQYGNHRPSEIDFCAPIDLPQPGTGDPIYACEV